MTRRILLAITGFCFLVGAMPAVAWADMVPAGLLGDWQGASLRRAGGGALGVNAKAWSVTVAKAGDGFRLIWTAPRWTEAGIALVRSEAEFEATERPAVLRATDIDSDLYDGSRNGNPLEGEPMLWATLSGPVLVVYGLRLGEDGSFVLDQLALEAIEGGVAVDYLAISESAARVVLQGHFVRAAD